MTWRGTPTEINVLVDDVLKQDPTLHAQLAGSAFNTSGRENIIIQLDYLFQKIDDLRKSLPNEFSLSVPPNLLAEIDTMCTMYLVFDNFRPQIGWSILPGKRAVKKEYDNEMNFRRAIAVNSLKLVRTYLMLEKRCN
jgi:hypothetical protein